MSLIDYASRAHKMSEAQLRLELDTLRREIIEAFGPDMELILQADVVRHELAAR